MIRADLQALLAALHPALELDDPGLLHAVEALADEDPADPTRREALLAVHGMVTAADGLPTVTAGVRRETLVRWDGTSSTWEGVDVATGRPALVRVLRPFAQRDPVARRALDRDARALAPVVSELSSISEAGALVALLDGPPFRCAPRGGHASAEALARLLAGTLAGLTRWEDAGLGIPPLAAEELRDDARALRVALLTPVAPRDAGPTLSHVAACVAGWWRDAEDHPLADLVEGLIALPPAHFAEAAERCTAALAVVLAEARHRVVHAAARRRRAGRHERLHELVERLEVCVPPPEGRGALGVDLEGRTLVVESDGEAITWGLDDEPPEVVVDPDDGFDVPLARRLVRARGSAPISERLNREVDGDPRFADAIARWVAAALELRTIRLLLDATDPA